MRFISPIIVFVLGLAALGTGIGQLTAWAPETSTVVESDTAEGEAPLTVITEGVVDPDSGRDTFTIEADGEYTVALARLHDIESWVDDAAHIRVDGVVEDGEGGGSWDLEHVEGESEVPSPSGSDMWVATETAEGALDYQWAAPDESGDWALMLFRDGSEPAPAQFSTEITQEEDTAVPVILIVLGALGILLSLVLFYRALAARRADQTNRRTEAAASDQTLGAGAVAAGDPAAASSEQTSEAPSEESAAAVPEAEADDAAVEDDADAGDVAADEAEVGEAESSAVQAEESAEGETTVIPAATEGDEVTGEDEVTGGAEAPDEGEDEQRGGWKRSSVATAAAVAIALSPSAVTMQQQADEQPQQEDADEQPQQDDAEGDAEESDGETPDAEQEISEEDGTPGEAPETQDYSVLVDSQLERIVEDIAEVVAEGDEAGDVELLEDRVDGNALDVRELSYRNGEISDNAEPEPIGTEILSAAVTSEQDFPRQAMVITQHEDAELPQVLMLEQESARENFKLTQAVTMDPSAEFPGLSTEDGGVGAVSPSSETAKFPADLAMERTAVFLNSADYYFGMHVQESAYIEDLQSYQQEVRDSAPDVTVSYTRPLNDAAALRLPDGSVLAVGSFDATEQLRPDEPGAAINFGEDGLLNELAGTSSTTADTDILSRESLILHIPADEDAQITVLGVDYIVSDVNIHE